MKPSAAKVARDWNSAHMEREILLFEGYVTAFWQAIRSSDRLVNYRWADMINSGAKLAPWLVETRAVPRGKAKPFEMAVRLFMSARQSPRNMASWVKRNDKNIAAFKVALKWPEKASADAGGEEVFRHDGFTVHNTVQLEGNKLEITKLAISKAVKAIRGMGVPNAVGNIYGNLFIVGRLTSPRTLAWYNVNADELYVRPHLRVGPGEIHALTHEIGHRYWHKLMQEGRKKFWRNYHWNIGNAPRGGITMPKAGDPMPVPVRGHKTPPVILEDVGHAYRLEGGGLIKKQQLIRILQQEAQQAKFPTPYAATSDSEHFAEAFAMYALGTLPAPAAEAFESIVVNGEQHQIGQLQKDRAPTPRSEFEDHPEVKAVEALLETVERKRLPTLKQDSGIVSLGLKKLKDGRLLPGQRNQLLSLFGLYEMKPPPGWGPPPPPPPKPTPPPPAPKPPSQLPERLPTGPALLTMVRELEARARKRRTRKVLKFVEGVREVLEDGGRLGPRREKRLTRILQSYGLMAGGTPAGRVANRWLEGDRWPTT